MIELADDGTMDTVLRCTDCGEEMRYSYSMIEPDLSPSESGLVCEHGMPDGDGCEGCYDAYVADCIADATADHECEPLELDAFTHGYLTCALWATDPEPGQGDWSEHDDYTIDNIARESQQAAIADCLAFQQDNRLDLEASGLSDSTAGHCFWLNRNQHGSGFWDRGNAPCFKALSDASHAYGETDVYLANDGTLYFM